MKKKILITACSLEVGGIERSLIGLLDAFDYTRYDVDVLLFSRKGELLEHVPSACNLLPEIPQLATLLQPIKDVLRQGRLLLGGARLLARTAIARKYRSVTDPQEADGVIFAQLQSYWDNSIRFMPRLDGAYDAAVSFMWPHHYVAHKVNAKRKIAWVHTDYTNAKLRHERDEAVWARFDRIAAVSDACGQAFAQLYPSLAPRVTTVENILSAAEVRRQAQAFEPAETAQDGAYRLLSVGRYCYAKAFDRAARVCGILEKRGLPIRWYIIGYGADEAQIREQIRASGAEDTFILLGKKLNPYPYMRSCDLYIQPSRYEGKAVTVREAQMLARPVLITDFATARSQVRDGLDAVIAPQDETLLADAIEALLRDEGKRRALSAYCAAQDYSNTEEIQKIYRMIGED